MKSGESKLVLGLLIGAAVGAAVAYLATTDKKDQIMDELGKLADKVKEGYQHAVSKYQEGKCEAKKEISEAVSE